MSFDLTTLGRYGILRLLHDMRFDGGVHYTYIE